MNWFEVVGRSLSYANRLANAVERIATATEKIAEVFCNPVQSAPVQPDSPANVTVADD